MPPLPNSYWVIPDALLAGEHPFGNSPADAHDRIAALTQAGITMFLDLTEPDEMPSYRLLLPRRAHYLRRPIADRRVPESAAQMHEIQLQLRHAMAAEQRVYVHCRAGIGRTGLTVGCYLVEQGLDGKSALRELNRLWKQSARSGSWPKVPQTEEQAQFVRDWQSMNP